MSTAGQARPHSRWRRLIRSSRNPWTSFRIASLSIFLVDSQHGLRYTFCIFNGYTGVLDPHPVYPRKWVFFSVFVRIELGKLLKDLHRLFGKAYTCGHEVNR